MNSEQLKYHADEFFRRHLRGLEQEIDSSFLDRELSTYHYHNKNKYGFIKKDRIEFSCIFSQLVQDKKLEIISKKGNEFIYRIINKK